MGHTFSNVLIHAIFSTKDRLPLIPADFAPRLWQYMGGIAREELGVALKIGGTTNHFHGLLSWRMDVAIADGMGKLKSLSSGWIKKACPAAEDFAWQAGYAAFSVSQSNAEKVRTYIDGQEEHHRVQTFEEEYLALLKKHGIDYDPRKVWE